MAKEDANIIEVSFKEALEERYLSYALSTIMSRSLPSARDGLKPVHRRLLFAMHVLRLDPKSAFKKCARVVGDVIGKYHPHGELAIYESLVRLAQDFTVRYPLIEGQGNFGSIDGDNAAAMRYTESRLSLAASYMLQDIEKDTVEFKPNYDGSEEEPTVLPANFPNLLANGAEGIAVGMATYIPPHNLEEICEAALVLLKKPNAGIEEIMEKMQGPDFPTGGILTESKAAIINAYTTGRGSLRLRSKWHKEELGHGLYRIIITEIPYQVKKSKLIEKLAELYRDKKIPMIGNILDESTDEVRIILEPKTRTLDPEMIMETLFKLTDLEIRINLNLNCLDKNNIPKLMNIKELLTEFLEHRKEVILRRSKFELAKVKNRIEILEGFIVAYLNLDELIAIIRNEDEPKPIIMTKWKLSDLQAESILNMRLRNLRKLEEFEIRGELDKLKEEQKRLEEIIESDKTLQKVIGNEIKDLIKIFGKATKEGARKTEIIEKEITGNVYNFEQFVEKEPLTIICSKMGWIRAQKGLGLDAEDFKYKEGDEEGFIFEGQSTDKLMVFSSSGKFFTIPCDKLPRGKGTGEPIRLMVDLGDDEIIAMFIYEPESRYLVASNMGKGFVVPASDIMAQTKNGRQVMNLPEKGKAMSCHKMDKDAVAVIGENRKLLVFKSIEIPEMKRGQGVTLQKYKDGGLSDIQIFNLEDGFNFQPDRGDIKLEKNPKAYLGNRAGQGKIPPLGFSKKNKFLF